LPRLLLVEDVSDFRYLVQLILKKLGHEVIEAANGEAAKAAFLKDKVDLVITDLKMARTDGLELTAWIKSQSKVPVLIMSGISKGDIDLKSIHADGFIRKPFSDDELIEAIDKCLTKNKSLD